MEDKMDGVAEAARKVRMVADKILPPRPHHLTVTPNRKYPPQDGFDFTGMSARLQYMTYLSDADRGLLMTVPYYEIIDEPEFAPPVKTVLRTEAKKKMSIKDYQNRKKSNSPTDATNNESSASADAKQGAVPDTNAVKEKEQEKAKPVAEQRLKEKTEPQPNAKTGASQAEQNSDSRNRSQPKPDPKTASASENRKRQPDRDDPLPPQKRMRTDDASKHALPRDTKPENARGRDGTREKTTHGEPKAARDATPSGATNGRLQVPMDAGDQSSPRSTILVNGARSRADSLTSTPRKGDRGDSSLKSSIPPLLSPLRAPASSIPPLLSPLRAPASSIPPLLSPLRLDSYEGTESPRKRPAGKAPMKGPPPKTGGHSRNTSMTKVPRSDLDSPRQMGQDRARDTPEKKAGQEKLRARPTKEKESQPLAKSATRPLRIPPLLSPTLPPIVEAELAALWKRLGESSHGSSLASASESPVSTKKPKAPAVSHEQPDEPRRRSLIVKVKYKKALKPRVKQVLQLPSSGLKKAGKVERSASVERIFPAKKRPRPTGDAAGEVVSKKSKLSTEQSVPPKPTIAAPTTPLKNNAATAMSRVLSNTSQANTPGDTTGLTPGVAERPPTSNDNNTDPVIAAKLSVQRKRYDEYNRLGSKLKRAKDAIIRNKSITLAEENRAGALHFEMVLSYMIAFKALDQNNLLSRRTLDFASWESILPHFPELRSRLRHSRALHALAIQIQAIILEELTQSFATLDEKQAMGLHARWAKNARQQTKIWREAQVMLEDGGLPEPKMRANIGPGSGIDESVRAALTVLRRWAEREGVDWKSEIEIPGSSGVNGA